MSREVEGVLYLTLAEVQEQMQVTRQTLWRWRREGVIPQGRRFRDRQVLFSEEEAALIRGHANRIEPITPGISRDQMSLFASDSGRADRS